METKDKQSKQPIIIYVEKTHHLFIAHLLFNELNMGKLKINEVQKMSQDQKKHNMDVFYEIFDMICEHLESRNEHREKPSLLKTILTIILKGKSVTNVFKNISSNIRKCMSNFKSLKIADVKTIDLQRNSLILA